MAVQTLILNVDRCTKNSYILFDAAGRLSVLPQDLEDAFATDSRFGFRAQGCRDAYCYLSCGATNSIFLCDRDHPQDAMSRDTFNHLVDAILWHPILKERYFARLRALLAQLSASGWLERQVEELRGLIGPDAREDARLWHTASDWDGNVNLLLDQIRTRRGQLTEQLAAIPLPPPPPPAPPPPPSPATVVPARQVVQAQG
jgi:hypothetical protein